MNPSIWSLDYFISAVKEKVKKNKNKNKKFKT